MYSKYSMYSTKHLLKNKDSKKIKICSMKFHYGLDLGIFSPLVMFHVKNNNGYRYIDRSLLHGMWPSADHCFEW